ncbi:MAG: hypothetical protein LQ351_007023 [Letrouitia transgressa]|nr:MAG: hypothetical protein LQ351_007023 [Letrouitia transgressa]
MASSPSPASTTSSGKKKDSSPPSLRLAPRAASTGIPTVGKVDLWIGSSRRKPAATDLFRPARDRHSVSDQDSKPLAKQLPPAGDSPIEANTTRSVAPTLSLKPVLQDVPSQPIDIPNPKPHFSRPVTPLTGRAEADSFTTSWQDHYTQSHHREYTQSSTKRFPSPESRSPTPPIRPDYSGSPLYTPSSPLSPTMPVRSPQGTHQVRQSAPRRPSNLHIPNLPPFHPANYELRNSPHRSSHTASPSAPPSRQLSDAQQKLQQYQRDIIMGATRAAGRTSMSPGPISKPTPPRLHPLGSPGPVTPLVLEGHDDYLTAGVGTGHSPLKEKKRQELLDKLICEENERRMHPGRMESHSPAISPAGGPG